MLMTITEAALSLGVSRGWVAQLVARKTIPAIRYGPIWLIREEDVEAARVRRGPGWPKGRPRKAKWAEPEYRLLDAIIVSREVRPGIVIEEAGSKMGCITRPSMATAASTSSAMRESMS